jgi:hypothetical protein
MIRFLSSVAGDNMPPPGSYATAILALILSLHGSIMLSDHSISTVSLSICAVVFLAKGLLLCETTAADRKLPSTSQNILEEVESNFVDKEGCQRRTCIDRLRTVSFLLTAGLLVSVFALYRFNLFDKPLPIKLWRNEITIAVIECGELFLICFLVYGYYCSISNSSLWNNIVTHLLSDSRLGF